VAFDKASKGTFLEPFDLAVGHIEADHARRVGHAEEIAPTMAGWLGKGGTWADMVGDSCFHVWRPFQSHLRMNKLQGYGWR
jgi:hypothetical protein